MESISLPKGRAIRVTWVDSHSRQGWFVKTNPNSTVEVVSQGFVLDSSVGSRTLVLSSSISTDTQFIDPLHIPWGAINSLELLPEVFDRN
jgi:hypothetical protein